jgi:hypothetical protein
MEGVEIKDLFDLVKKTKAKQKELEEQSQALEQNCKANLDEAIKKESTLQEQLKKDREIIGKMEAEYLDLEAKVENEKRTAIEESSLKEIDVKEGRVSLTEFFRKGKKKKEIIKMTIEEVMKELSETLETIRSKRKEILTTELSICEQQRIIFNLGLYPGAVLKKNLEGLKEFVEREMNILFGTFATTFHDLEMKKTEMLLTEGKGLGAGHSWSHLTFSEAHAVIFNPILPKKLIPELKEKLKEFEGTDQRLNITYRLPHHVLGGEGIEVALELSPGCLVKTSGKEWEGKMEGERMITTRKF